jgi:membrane protein
VTLLKWGSFILIPLFFISLCLFGFRQLPAVKPPWRAVFPGAIATGLALAIGEGLIVYYAAHNPIPTFFGLAGSVVIVMVWAYISALIFLFGAEFTRLYALWQGGEIVLSAGAPDFVQRSLSPGQNKGREGLVIPNPSLPVN